MCQLNSSKTISCELWADMLFSSGCCIVGGVVWTVSCLTVDVEYLHQVDDELMRFFERCRGYVEGVEKNRTALQEVEKFKHGDEMEAVRRRMANRLGLPHHLLTVGEYIHTNKHKHTYTFFLRYLVNCLDHVKYMSEVHELVVDWSLFPCGSCRSGWSSFLLVFVRAVNQIGSLAMVLPVWPAWCSGTDTHSVFVWPYFYLCFCLYTHININTCEHVNTCL